MRNLGIIAILLVLVFSFEREYDSVFYSSYNDALGFIETNEERFKEILGDDSLMKEKISIIFPEIIKCSLYKNIIETKALELLYVNYGKGQMDFSIGYFQMKPSFIEKLENAIVADALRYKKYFFISSYKNTIDKNIRTERIARLKSLEWQLRYLDCFYNVMQKLHPDAEGYGKEYRVRFFATAYNYDFAETKENIEKWVFKRAFPYGVKKGRMQYAYSDIAFYYYNDN